MENWLSIAAGIFLAAMVLYGHYKGFIRLAVSAAALIIALVSVNAVMPQITGFLKKNTGIYEAFELGMRKTVNLEETADAGLPSHQREVIEELPLPGQLKKALLENNNSEIYEKLGAGTFTEYISRYLADTVLNCIAFLSLFAVIFAVLHIITTWLDLVARLPILHGMNKIAGAVLGGAEGIFFLWILGLFATALSGTGLGRELIAQIEKSQWLSFVYDHNLLNSMLLAAIQKVF